MAAYWKVGFCARTRGLGGTRGFSNWKSVTGRDTVNPVRSLGRGGRGGCGDVSSSDWKPLASVLLSLGGMEGEECMRPAVGWGGGGMAVSPLTVAVDVSLGSLCLYVSLGGVGGAIDSFFLA